MGVISIKPDRCTLRAVAIKLKCRHQNPVHTMAHAQHLCSLINRALAKPITAKSGLPDTLYALIFEAANQLSSPGHKNASLIAFLKSEQAQAAIKKVSDLKSNKVGVRLVTKCFSLIE